MGHRLFYFILMVLSLVQGIDCSTNPVLLLGKVCGVDM